MLARIIYLRHRRQRRRNGGLGMAARLVLVAIGMIPALAFLSLAGAVGSVAGVYAYYARTLPPPEEIQLRSQAGFKTTKIYDRTGKVLLYEVFDPRWGNRTIVPLQQIPLHLRQATIAIEDRDFYTNPGLNLRGLARAMLWNLTRSGSIQGGSSITQQLVKNVLIPEEERYQLSYARKVKEAILALETTRRYSKDQILEWYLNTVDYGNHAYGVQAAAQAYFNKDVQDLTLAEAAMLAIIPQAPATNSPLTNPLQAKKRQRLVLEAMWQEGYISEEEFERAKAEVLQPKPQRFEILAPHFVMYVRQKLEEQYGTSLLYRGGLKVITSIDLGIQEAAQEIARQHIAALQKEKRNVSNAAVVVIKPQSGEILAMLGSLDYFNPDIDGQVNVALSSRQPGSSFKPFTYAEAFNQGYTPATMIMDVPISFPDVWGPYAPENFDHKYHGPQLLRGALACSYNIPAVKLLEMVGVRKVVDLAHRMGITTLNQESYGLSLTLGGGEVRLLDMTYAFGAFANGGVMAGHPLPPERRRRGYAELEPVAILRVEDASGQVLEEYGPSQVQTKEVLNPQVAYLLTHILADNEARVPMFGPASPLQLSRPAAVKTGTTDDWRDTWAIGYTPQVAVGVWVGNSNGQPMGPILGVRAAAPIWHDLMERILAPLPVAKFVEPPGLQRVEVCSTSGLLPTPYCPKRKVELFIKGTAPKSYDNLHRPFRICKPSGKLATIYCPPDQVEEKVFEIYPAEAADWVRENKIPQPPTEYDTTFGPGPGQEEVSIISPTAYVYLRGGLVPIMGRAKGPDFAYYRLEYGQGLDPSAWIQIGPNHDQPQENGFLENWDVSSLEGIYTLQLSVMAKNGSVRQNSIQVVVDKTPPKVQLSFPRAGAVYYMKEDEYVGIQAEAVDNISMERVEFYLDGQLLGLSTVAPYSKRWTIYMFSAGLESHTVHAIAYDMAGNSAQSEKVTFRVLRTKY